MINTKQWADLLNRQYSLVSSSGGGLDLLLAVRRFVAFLDTDPRARRYIKELDYQWDAANRKRRSNFNKMRAQLRELEGRIREAGAELDAVIEISPQTPDAAQQSIHILDKIREADWYQSWADARDDLDMYLLHVEEPPQTQTGYMIASAARGKARRLVDLAKALEREPHEELEIRAEELWRQYQSARRKLKNDWMSSGKHALEQLRIAVSIIDGDIFVDPANYDYSKLRSISPWMALMVMYAPSELGQKFEWHLSKETNYRSFEQDVEPLIKSHVRRVFEELQALADSRLAHQHLVERYKVRCENYDSKNIEGLITNYVGKVQGKKEEEKQKRITYRFEDLLTLHFARYLYDSGYTVHCKLKVDKQEPDLLVSSGDLELEPIVVEAKIIGQEHGTPRRRPWIFEGFNALHSYLEKFHSDYGVTDGYLIIFRIGDKSPIYTFNPQEWSVGHFTIVPKLINLGGTGKEALHEVIRKEDWIADLES